jgi:mycofactocin precursor
MERKEESYMKKLDVEMSEKKEDLKQQEDDNPQDNIFDTEEIRIEEMAIDGICGVY